MPGPSNLIETEKICFSTAGLRFPVTVSSYRAIGRATLPLGIQPIESPGSLDLEANCLHKLPGKICSPILRFFGGGEERENSVESWNPFSREEEDTGNVVIGV